MFLFTCFFYVCFFFFFFFFFTIVPFLMQGIVTGIGESSEFGNVFKMMQSEEVHVCGLTYSILREVF